MTKIELLAPARDLQVGKAAIDSGADAVYIGAPMFGARQAAGNTLEDIASLCQYAHLFDVRVWVTLNTILTDDELPQAEKLAWQLYEAGVDGLIIQDMGLLTMNLPPLRLHASTQCNNRTPEKVRWLQEIGFQRVVLARELSLEEIRTIRHQTTIELEGFIHGALCVSYSGQCYFSEAMCGRSANRGACAQMCRQKYDVLDKDGNLLLQDRYILSLHDMDRSHSIRDLLNAGITSLKIEGRLKDETYVRNVVGYYRQLLDRLFAEPHSPYCRASKGIVSLPFTPNPTKTFHRGGIDYFLHTRTPNMVNLLSPKSTGEYIGKVLQGGKQTKCITVETSFMASPNGECRTANAECRLTNGDGLCYGDKGFLINKVDGNCIYPNQPIDIEAGTPLYRNYDKEFMQQLERTATTSPRKLPVTIRFSETPDGFSLQFSEGNYPLSIINYQFDKQPAKNAARAEQTIREQLTKLGDTPFVAESVTIDWSQAYFLPISVLNEWRRQAVEAVLKRDAIYGVSTRVSNQETRLKGVSTSHYPATEPTDYRLNIYNQCAREFYAQCGVTEAAQAFEVTHESTAALMTCRYCLLHELGMCRKMRHEPLAVSQEPAFIRTSGKTFRLHFDCKHCEMQIFSV